MKLVYVVFLYKQYIKGFVAMEYSISPYLSLFFIKKKLTSLNATVLFPTLMYWITSLRLALIKSLITSKGKYRIL